VKKTLFLGDPHVMVTNLEESEDLLDFLRIKAKDHEVDSIVILGDLFHNFSVLRVEVLNFWREWLQILSDKSKVYVLVGNHDRKNQSNDEDNENALQIFNLINSPNLNIIQSPVSLGSFGFVPYIHDKIKFVEVANGLAKQGAKTLIAHADWDGAQYENGYYAPDGVKQEDINCDLIIGGHIHKRSRFGKVILPGTARWLNSSDKNEEKGLWLVEFNDQGGIEREEFLDTSHVCTPIYAYQYKEGGEEISIPSNSRASVELIGSSEWISKQKAKFKGLASISCKITDKARPANRKTGNSFEDWLTRTYETTQGLKKDSMVAFMRELGILKETELS
jgi:DNA repair exonuclease SbcCD nuclease subunit